MTSRSREEVAVAVPFAIGVEGETVYLWGRAREWGMRAAADQTFVAPVLASARQHDHLSDVPANLPPFLERAAAAKLPRRLRSSALIRKAAERPGSDGRLTLAGVLVDARLAAHIGVVGQLSGDRSVAAGAMDAGIDPLRVLVARGDGWLMVVAPLAVCAEEASA